MSEVIVIGSCVADLTFYTKKLPVPGQTVVGKFDSGLGGKGFNQAVACARAGAKTLFIGAVGDDTLGAAFKSYKENGLTTKIFTIKNKKTGAATINIDSSGNNSIIVSLGANEALSLSHIKPLKDAFKKAKVLLLQRENSDQFLNDVIKFARTVNPENLTIILNPAPLDSNAKIKERVDFLTPNETEACILSGIEENTQLTRENFNQFVLGSGIKFYNMIVTLGERGCFCYPECKFFSPLSFGETVDTSGAGDAFNGGLAAGLAMYHKTPEKKFSNSVLLGTVIAGLSVTKPGTSKSFPTQVTVKKELKKRIK